MRLELRFICPLKNGVHARPASVLAEVARRYASRVTIGREDVGAKSRLEVDARSVLSVVGLDITLGEACVMVVEGEDAEVAAEELRGLVDRAWLETDELPAMAANGRAPAALPIGIRRTGVAHVVGVPACGGIGIGQAVVVAGLALSRELMEARAESAEEEMRAVERAVETVSRELRRRSEEASGQFEGELLRAHAGIVEDPALRAELGSLVRGGATAAQAVVRASEKFSAALAAAGSAYVRDRAVDVQDVCGQVLEELAASMSPSRQGETGGTVALTGDSVIVADVLTANQLMKMDASKVKGLVLGSVGATAHTVILARSLRIPTVLEARSALGMVAPGEVLVVDGDGGFALRASPEVRRYYQRRGRTEERRRARLEPIAKKPGATCDGARLEVGVNAATAPEVEAGVKGGAEGVGLLRTELLFLDREEAPGEQEQFEAYGAVVKAAAGRPVIIRTLDIGGDKPAAYLRMAREENPFLGCRGLRLYEKHPELLRIQLRAIVRASAAGSVKVMAPMVSTAREAAWFKERVREVQAELGREGVEFDEGMPVGVMVEVPALALVMDRVAASVDFVSIGTNDLCQYWMASDRGNRAVAGLCNPHDPSFLRLLMTIVKGAREHGIWVGVCGEMAGRKENLPLMVGLGVDEISAAPGEVLGLKVQLAGMDSAGCREVLAEATACAGAKEVKGLLMARALTGPSGGQRHGQRPPVIEPQAIVVGSDAETKEEAVREAVDAMYVAGRTERPGDVEEAVWARERTYSTGLGYGFAVPHCKSDGVEAPTLAVVKLAKPVEWGSSDGGPVGVVMLLAVPAGDTSGAHMKVFATLCRRLMHEEFRERMVRAETAAEIEAALREELGLE